MITIRKKTNRNAVKQHPDNRGITKENSQHGENRRRGKAKSRRRCRILKNWDEDHRKLGETQKTENRRERPQGSGPKHRMRKGEDQRAKKRRSPSRNRRKQPHKRNRNPEMARKGGERADQKRREGNITEKINSLPPRA